MSRDGDKFPPALHTSELARMAATGVSRRSVLRSMGLGVSALAAGSLLSACGGSSAGGAPRWSSRAPSRRGPS